MVNDQWSWTVCNVHAVQDKLSETLEKSRSRSKNERITVEFSIYTWSTINNNKTKQFDSEAQSKQEK